MGYYSTVSGDLIFSRPASPRVLAELQGSSSYNTINFFFAVNSSGLTATEEMGTAYELVAELQRMVRLLQTDGASAHGVLLIEGEDRDDVWRVLIEGAEVREEHATVTVVWPERELEAAPSKTPPRTSFGWLP